MILARDATDSRKLERGVDEVDARDEPEHVELEAFVAAGDDAEEPSRAMPGSRCRSVCATKIAPKGR